MANTLEGPGPHSGLVSPEIAFFAFFAQDTLLWQAFGEVVDQRTETLGAVLLGSFFGGTYFSPDGGGGGSSRMFSQAQVIAKGRRIGDVNRLIREYGGTRQGWRKMKGWDETGQEWHWYEHTGIGRVEFKPKNY
jgi:hypothetical protein